MIAYCYAKDPVHRSRPFQVSRVMCVARPFPHCAECDNREFVAVLANVKSVVSCPVGRLAATARGSDLVHRLKRTNRLLATDVLKAMTANLDGCSIEKEVCQLRSLFYACTGCKGDPTYDPHR